MQNSILSENKKKILSLHCPVCQNEVLKDIKAAGEIVVGSIICNKCQTKLELQTEIKYKLVKKS